MFRKLLTFLLALCWTLAGCGSSNNFVQTSDNPLSSGGPFYAQVYLEQNEVTADLRVEVDGTVLATLPGGQGIFRLPSSLPTRFTLVGELENGLALRRDVDLSDPTEGKFFVVNAVSHMAALLRQRNPELSRAEALFRVRRGLDIPETLPTTDKLSSLPGSPFSHRVFAQEAASLGEGGYAALAEQIVEGVEQGQVRAFRQPLLQLDVNAGEAILGGLLGNVCATPFTLVETQAIGWAAGKMGFENSTEKQLDSIADQLNALSAQISALSSQLSEEITGEQFQDDATALARIYTPANNQQANLASTASSQASAYASTSNLGPQVPNVAQNLLTGFNTINLANSLDTVIGYLLGSRSFVPGTTSIDNVITTYNSLANVAAVGGSSDAGRGFNYTSRSDVSTQTYFLPNLQYYSQLLMVLGNLIVETAHAITLPQTASGEYVPAHYFNAAQRDIYDAAYAYQLAQQQLPQMINYPVYVDLENVKLWSADFFPEFPSVEDAEMAAATWSVGPFTGGWQLASSQDWTILRNRALSVVGNNEEQIELGYAQVLGQNIAVTPYFFVSDSSDVWDPIQGELVSSKDLPNGNGFAAYLRVIPNGTYGDSPYVTVFNYGLTIPEGLTITRNGNQLTATLPAYTGGPPGSSSTPQDVTNLVAWSSNATSLVDVSNVISPEGATNPLVPGQLIFHTPNSDPDLNTAIITATFMYGDGGSLTGSISVSPQDTPTLNGVLLSPQNVLYPTLPQQTGQGGYGQQFYFTGFLSDLTAVDLTRNANTEFTLYQLPNANIVDPTTVDTSGLTEVPSSVASFESAVPGFLSINSSGGVSPFTNPNVLVVATFTDTTTGTVYQQGSQLSMPTGSAPPPPPPSATAPVINVMSPSFGDVLGGTVVNIFGKNLTGTTSVTFAGNSAQFLVITNTQITLTTPSYLSGGSVPVVLTTPEGQAGATFLYGDF